MLAALFIACESALRATFNGREGLDNEPVHSRTALPRGEEGAASGLGVGEEGAAARRETERKEGVTVERE